MTIKLVKLAIHFIFIGSGLAIVLMNISEFYIAYYSGADPVSPSQKAMLLVECILLLVTVALVAIGASRLGSA